MRKVALRQVTSAPPVTIISPIIHTHLNVNTNLKGRRKGETPDSVCTQQRRFPYEREALYRTAESPFFSIFGVNATEKEQGAFSVIQIPSPLLCLGFHGDACTS